MVSDSALSAPSPAGNASKNSSHSKLGGLFRRRPPKGCRKPSESSVIASSSVLSKVSPLNIMEDEEKKEEMELPLHHNNNTMMIEAGEESTEVTLKVQMITTSFEEEPTLPEKSPSHNDSREPSLSPVFERVDSSQDSSTSNSTQLLQALQLAVPHKPDSSHDEDDNEDDVDDQDEERLPINEQEKQPEITLDFKHEIPSPYQLKPIVPDQDEEHHQENNHQRDDSDEEDVVPPAPPAPPVDNNMVSPRLEGITAVNQVFSQRSLSISPSLLSTGSNSSSHRSGPQNTLLSSTAPKSFKAPTPPPLIPKKTGLMVSLPQPPVLNITEPHLEPSPVESPMFGHGLWGKISTPPATITVMSPPVSGQASVASSQKTSRSKTTAEVIRNDIWSQDQDVVLEALRSITAEASSEKARSLIARTGGLLAIVRAMETHSKESSIQIAGCKALEKLAIDTDNEIAIEQVGGVDTIMNAMMGHFNDVQVQEAAWAALWNLTCTNASKEMTFDVAGGMHGLVMAMKEHMDSPAVQKNACGALANLCSNSSSRMEGFTQANGFLVLATALTRYWNSDPDVRAEACYAMMALCEGHACYASRANTTAPAHTTLVPLPTQRSISGSGASVAGSVASHRGYLPRHFNGGPLPHMNTNLLGRPTAHRPHEDNSDLRSLASSYFEEETVFDDRSMGL